MVPRTWFNVRSKVPFHSPKSAPWSRSIVTGHGFKNPGSKSTVPGPIVIVTRPGTWSRSIVPVYGPKYMVQCEVQGPGP